MLRVAVHHDDQLLMSGRRQSFSGRWCATLADLGHEPVPVRASHAGFFATVRRCDGFMWWFAHLPDPRNRGTRVVQAIEHGAGIPVFPSSRTIWHFDDKIAQQYLLEAAGIPVPETHVFWAEREARAFCAAARYPIVIKLTSGITSENVAILNSREEADYWTTRLFRHGVVSLKRRGFVVHPGTMARRLRDAGRFVASGALPPLGKRTDLQRDYLLVQEFLDGNAFDTRVTVIGNRAFAFRRFNRPNDFRASGSGLIDWDPSSIQEDAVRLAFRVARCLGTQSLAVDVLRREDQPVINEISYYYEGWAVAECPGHWALGPGDSDADGTLTWIDGKRAPEDLILEDFLDDVSAAERGGRLQTAQRP